MARSDSATPSPARDTGYDYIKRTYGLDYQVGQRVRLEDSTRTGTVACMNPSAGHYVQVLFDGRLRASPCHPESLSILQESAHDDA